MGKRIRKASRLGKIGVLMGGPSTERDISLKSGHAVYESLKRLNLDVVPIDIENDDVRVNTEKIKSHGIDLAFLALHGRFGEDGQIQELLDTLRIPYTCSGTQASRLAMDKIISRRLLQIYGISVPRFITIDRAAYHRFQYWHYTIRFPLVIKPVTHGSSIGISFVDKLEDLDKAVTTAFEFDQKIMIEEYIKGREVTIGILDDKALPVIEIIPKKGFFDYESKYQPGMTEYVVPAPLAEESARRLQDTAVAVHKILGCSGCSRVDIILADDGTAYVLELNSIPGFTPTSLLPKAAQCAGIGFSELCCKLIELAYKRG